MVVLTKAFLTQIPQIKTDHTDAENAYSGKARQARHHKIRVYLRNPRQKIVLRAKEAIFTVDLHFAPIFKPLGPILANIVNQATFNKALLRPE